MDLTLLLVELLVERHLLSGLNPTVIEIHLLSGLNPTVS